MRYVLLSVLGLILLGAGGFVWLSWYSGLAPVVPPARAAFAPAAIARGARLAAVGDCAACHTAPGGAPFAGGLKLQTPFGAIYTTNITPDPHTGIGTWSEAAFRRAMRQGVDRRGRLLYPAFPYDHFTLLTDADDADLYAYLMTRAPVRATAPPNDLPFPLGFRPVLALWRLAFFRPGPYRPDPQRSAAWNRGAYLTRGAAHCGACHTPRNILGAETARRFAGGDAQGWYAYALDQASPAREPWTAATLYDYLRHGWQAQHGDALGPMRDVTQNLAAAPDDDLRAIAGYVAAQRAAETAAGPRAGTPAATPPASAPTLADSPGPGGALYSATCAACHEGSAGPPYAGLALAQSSAVRAPNPINLLNIVRHGIPAAPEQAGPIMPGFGTVLDDTQLTALLGYIRARFGGAPAWKDLGTTVQSAHQGATPSGATP